MTLYTLIESFGLIPEMHTFKSEHARDDYIRDLILRADTGELDSWVAATAEGNYNEEEAPGTDATEDEKLDFLMGGGFLSDGNKWELRTDEIEVGS